MILITRVDKPLQFNAKSLARYGVILKEYNDEIEAFYKDDEGSTQRESAPPPAQDEASTLKFMRTVVQSTLGRGRQLVDDEGSLQSTYIRNTPLHTIAPTIAALAHLFMASSTALGRHICEPHRICGSTSSGTVQIFPCRPRT